MSLHFYPLTIEQIKKETGDCVSITFIIPENLKNIFAYKHGQYITIKTIIEGVEARRSYSLCSSPLDNEFKIAIKKIKGGLFSSFANDVLKAGDVLEAMPPMGKFYTTLNSTNKKEYVGFAAGSGITPMLSIIKTTLQTEPNSSFTLIYGNKNSTSIIFKEQLEALKNKHLSRFQLIHILSREKTDADINYGRIDHFKCNHLFENLLNINSDEFFICGPEEMIFSIKYFLESRMVDENKIHFELFTSAQPHTSKSSNQVAIDDSPKSNITVKVDGRTFDFDLAFKGNNILDAALQKGADLPYACKGGVCCTCKAKLLEGAVNMDVSWGLEKEEIEQGFILTCQAHPTTDKVVVDFDIK
jgi:ring-1,2-phenylacetyl-CoA epoxidase subunit PaaE